MTPASEQTAGFLFRTRLCLLIFPFLLCTANAQFDFLGAPATERKKQFPADQEPELPAPEQSQGGVKGVLDNVLQDHIGIWTSPRKVKKSDLKWIVPLVAGTAALIQMDRHVADELADTLANDVSRDISNLGGPTNFLSSATLYGVGKLADDERLARTGLLGVRAVAATWITVQIFKQATNRQRPTQGDGHGNFWAGGTSFPSGHSASTWALATVVATRYPEKPVLKFGMYGLATMVAATRLTGEKHFLSDVVVGGVIGHLIGRYVVRRWKE